MKNTIFLTSSVNEVAKDVVAHIENFHPGMKLVFIYTASEVEEGDLSWQDNDRQALVTAGFDVSDYTITGKAVADLRKDMESFEVIYVGGGNTFYLLQQMRVSGFDTIIHSLIDSGKLYIGTSAGSMIAGPDIYPAIREDKMEKAPLLHDDFTGLGLVDFTIMPHWGAVGREELFLKKRLPKIYSKHYKLILLTNAQYVRVSEDGMMKIEEVVPPRRWY